MRSKEELVLHFASCFTILSILLILSDRLLLSVVIR